MRWGTYCIVQDRVESRPPFTPCISVDDHQSLPTCHCSKRDGEPRIVTLAWTMPISRAVQVSWSGKNGFHGGCTAGTSSIPDLYCGNQDFHCAVCSNKCDATRNACNADTLSNFDERVLEPPRSSMQAQPWLLASPTINPSMVAGARPVDRFGVALGTAKVAVNGDIKSVQGTSAFGPCLYGFQSSRMRIRSGER